MALVGNTFYQSSASDPGTGYAMYYWNQTDTGLIYVRNAGDTAWVLVGDSQLPYLGQLSTQGGVMNGAITGAHGLSLSSSNDFNANSLRMGGDLVSTKAYVDAQVATLNAAIATGIATAIASAPSLNLSTKIAFATGIWGPYSGSPTIPNQVINPPYYSDGIQADPSECVWGVALTSYEFGHVFTSGNTEATAVETPVGSRIYVITKTDAGEGSNATFAWWIIAFRKSS